MKRRRFVLLPLLALAGCLSPEAPAPAPPAVAGDTLAALRTAYGVQPQYFNCDPRLVSTYRTPGGSFLSIGYQAFLSAGTAVPAPGPVRLEWREVFGKADMVLSGIPSMAGGEVMEAGGAFFLQAAVDRRPLLLSARVRLGLATRPPAQLADHYGMGLYYPRTSSPANRFPWEASTDTASSVRVPPSLPGDPANFVCLLGQGLFNHGTGWVGFLRPISTGGPPAAVRVAVAPPAGAPPATAANTVAYLVFHDYNAVAQLEATAPGEFALPRVPAGAAATAFVLYANGGRLYLGQQVGRTGGPAGFAAALVEASPAAVAAAARQLP